MNFPRALPLRCRKTEMAGRWWGGKKLKLFELVTEEQAKDDKYSSLFLFVSYNAVVNALQVMS
jgi:hypothetical protein